MEIKTTKEIIDEMNTAHNIVNSRQSTDYPNSVLNNAVDITETKDKKWIAVDDMIELIKKVDSESKDAFQSMIPHTLIESLSKSTEPK